MVLTYCLKMNGIAVDLVSCGVKCNSRQSFAPCVVCPYVHVVCTHVQPDDCKGSALIGLQSSRCTLSEQVIVA